ncbi:hypothetical protein B0H14DRAFT_2325155, partial [Mycena olivaceomarginata]
DMVATGGEYGTALQAASYGTGLEVVALFLDNDRIRMLKVRVWGSGGCATDMGRPGSEYGTEIQAASYERKLEVVTLLLCSGGN